MSTFSRRVMALAGGLVLGGAVGAILDEAVANSPDGSFKGLLAGLGIGLMAAGIVKD